MRAGAPARILASPAGNCPIPKRSGARLRQFRIALFQFHDGGTRYSKGAFSSISFSNCLRVCSLTRGSGLSPPVLKEGQFLVTPRGQFSMAREEISSHLRLYRIRRMVFGHQRGTARGHHGTARKRLRRFRKCPSLSAESRAGQYNLASKMRQRTYTE
jgi:hypothetical protein